MSSGIYSNNGIARVTFVPNGFNLGGPISWDGSGGYGRILQAGAIENFSIGYPSAPSLQLTQYGFWRFRWTVLPGTHTVSIYVNQPANVTPVPSLIVKANPAIGVNTDVAATSSGGTGWVVIGPASITASSQGVLWVQLWNNYDIPHLTPAPAALAPIPPLAPTYWGQITVT